MKSLALGIGIGLAVGAAATATAAIGRSFYLNEGDWAIPLGGATACQVIRYKGSQPGFRCRVGGDYRAKFGVIITEQHIAVTRYTGFHRYRIFWERRQTGVA